MKAYITSIGEKTTSICFNQLKRFGFEPVIIDGNEPWIEKYRRFIDMALENKESCIRVDADVIVNKNIFEMKDIHAMMACAKVYDFYANDLHGGGPIFYSYEALSLVKKNFQTLNPERPETAAWRLIDIVNNTITLKTVVGLHGFFQDDSHFERHMKHRSDRGQNYLVDRFFLEDIKKLR